jgi:uncharacterized protein (UPF0276 family)
MPVSFMELLTERFLDARGGVRFQILEKVREEVPVALHCTTLSIGSVDPLDRGRLQRVRELADHLEAVWVSDHLAWCSLDGRDLELMPLPYNEECLDHLVRRVQAVQDALGPIPLLLENPSSHLEFAASTMPEWEFLGAVARRSGCRILLDLNNVVVSSTNLGFDPARYVDSLPADCVWQIHLSGHRPSRTSVTIDNHEGPVPDAVWSLYRQAVRRFGPVPTILEWDTNVPPLPEFVAECGKAAAIEAECLHDAA